MNTALIVASIINMNQVVKRRREEDDANYQTIRQELMDDDWDGSEDELNREADSIFLERYGYEY